MTAYWDSVRERIDRSDIHVGTVAFYLGVLVYVGFLWTYTPDFRGSSLPRVIIYITAVISLLGLVSHVVIAKGYVENPYRRDGRDEIEEVLEDASEGETGGVSPVVFAKTILTILLFTVLIPLVGFFSASFLFSSTFIFDRTRNVRKSALAAVALTLVFYVLFILILENYLLLRLGVIDRYVFETLLA